MRTQARGEHACTPRPPSWFEFGHAALLGRCHDLHVVHGVQGLLLTGIRDFGDGGHLKIWWLADAAEIAVADCIDRAIAPHTSTFCRLFHNLHVLVEVDPTATTWALVTQDLLGHEVVRCLDTDAHIGHIRTTGHFNLLPELLRLWIVLAAVELLDACSVHVLSAVFC